MHRMRRRPNHKHHYPMTEAHRVPGFRLAILESVACGIESNRIVSQDIAYPNGAEQDSFRRFTITNCVILAFQHISEPDFCHGQSGVNGIAKIPKRLYSVVPATAGPLGERPPALAGHFCDVPTTLPC